MCVCTCLWVWLIASHGCGAVLQPSAAAFTKWCAGVVVQICRRCLFADHIQAAGQRTKVWHMCQVSFRCLRSGRLKSGL
jgi:hypothetical protein